VINQLIYCKNPQPSFFSFVTPLFWCTFHCVLALHVK